jgi:hypothetical protein
MVATVVADVLAWFLFVGLTLLGLTVTVVGTARTYRSVQKDGKTRLVAIATAAGVAIVLFLGGWLFLALYWLVIRALRMIQRTEAG